MKILRIPLIIVLLVVVGRAFDAGAQTETSLYSFAGPPGDGEVSYSGLVQGSDSNFYGTTYFGGTSTNCPIGCGTMFRISPGGSETILHSFAGYPNDGAYPEFAGVVQGSDGNFYGTTSSGGTNNLGAVFRITPSGSETILYSFSSYPYDGYNPVAGLVQGSDGNFYGTTYSGGSNLVGTVFRISPGGSYTSLYSFVGYPDGANPAAGLVQGSDSNFYGTTGLGGTLKEGTVFRISPSGSYTSLYSFVGYPSDGALPEAGLVQGSDGNFYGTTYQGGTINLSPGAGTVFRISPGGSETILYSFGSFPTDGVNPNGGLVQASDGDFYGTTTGGGTNSDGTVFGINPNGIYESVYSFVGYPTDGMLPYAGLVQGSDGNFYGTTSSGGTNDDGTVFRFTPSVCGSPVANFGPFRITGLAIMGSSVLTTWLAPEGSTNVVQATNGGASGNYSNNFVTISPLIVIPGPNPCISVTTNYLDVGGATNMPARYYRVVMGNVTGIVITQAVDNAADPAYSSGWGNGATGGNGGNGGNGFGPWLLTLTSSSNYWTQTSSNNYCNGFFVGSSTNSTPRVQPGIDVNNLSWGLYANNYFCGSPEIAAAFRVFASGPVQVGGQLLIDMDNGLNDGTGSAVGFALRSGNATNSPTDYSTGARVQFYLAGGSPDYTVVDAAGAYDSGVPLTYTGVHLIFAPGMNDSYTLTIITDGSGSTNTVIGTLGGTPNSTLDSIALFNNDNGTNSSHDLFFNSMEIIAP